MDTAAVAAGRPVEELAAEWGVTPKTIYLILRQACADGPAEAAPAA